MPKLDTCVQQSDRTRAIHQLAACLDISVAALNPYKETFIVRRYKKGQVLYYQDDEVDMLYVLLDGIVMRETLNANGERYIDLTSRPDMFPIDHVFNYDDYTEMCTALDTVEVLMVPKRLIAYLCKTQPHVFARVYTLLTEAHQLCRQRNLALLGKNAEQQVIYTLHALCTSIGNDQGEFYELNHVLTIKLLSEMVGISRESTSMIIHQLMDQHYIVKDKKMWLIRKALYD